MRLRAIAAVWNVISRIGPIRLIFLPTGTPFSQRDSLAPVSLINEGFEDAEVAIFEYGIEYASDSSIVALPEKLADEVD